MRVRVRVRVRVRLRGAATGEGVATLCGGLARHLARLRIRVRLRSRAWGMGMGRVRVRVRVKVGSRGTAGRMHVPGRLQPGGQRSMGSGEPGQGQA